MQFGRPTLNTFRPEYLAFDYLQSPNGTTGVDNTTSVLTPVPEPALAPAPALMHTVSVHPEGPKDSNWARLAGISLMVLAAGLVLKPYFK